MDNSKYIEINGVSHFFVEYIYDESKPVVLYVHGGPGLSESLLGGEMMIHTGEIANFIFYDQRGCGRTYAKNPDEVADYEKIYEDLSEIVKLLYERFGKKIYIMAHNWGTLVAIRYVHDNPELVAGYIGYGQLVDMKSLAKIRMQRVKELALRSGSKHDAKQVDKLFSIAGENFDKSLLSQSKLTKSNVLLTKYNVSTGADKDIMTRIPKSPLYDMSDLKYIMSAPKLGAPLSAATKDINLFEQNMEYNVPMMFIAGDWDYQSPYVVAKEYMEQLKAPSKKLSILTDIGVNAMNDDPGEFWDAVLRFVCGE